MSKLLSTILISLSGFFIFPLVFGFTTEAAVGLVAEYGFNELTGTTLTDSSGSNNNGTLNGPTWNATGKYGGALSFDGLNDMVTVNDANSLDLTSGMTLEAWVKPTQNGNWRSVILKEKPGNLSYALYSSNTSNRPYVEITNPGMKTAVANSSLSTTTWTHVAATYNGSNLRFYVNGNLVKTTNTSGNITTSSNPLRIGGNQVWGEFFTGLIDEVRIYNRALTQAEIQTDMNTAVVSDSTPPSVGLTEPTEGATVSGSGVNLTATASDNVGVAGIQFKVDSVNLGSEDTTAPYGAVWNTTTLANGSHTITATARDTANNLTTSTEVTVTVNNPPKLNITQPTNGSSVSDTSIHVTYNAVGDLAEADHAHFRLDGGNTVMDIDFDGSYTFANIPAGSHSLVGIIARADHTEISGSDHTISFTNTVPDTNPPTVEVTSPLEGSEVIGTINVTASALDDTAVESVQFKVDGVNLGSEDTTAPYSVSWNSTTVGNGPHVLTALARDPSSNTQTSVGIGVVVANTDPRAQVGEWGSLLDWPLVAVHGTLLNNGKILLWDAWEFGTTNAKLYDPQSGSFVNVPVQDQLFCSAHVTLNDGKILVSGGHNGGEIGIRDTHIFDPASSSWSNAADMNTARWYPTNTKLSDGRVVTFSGQITGGNFADTPEIYNPTTDTWTPLGVNTNNFHDSEYPLNFLLPNGKIYALGATPGVAGLLDVTANTWTTSSAPTTKLGTVVQYRPGKLLSTGGGDTKESNNPSKTQTSIIDFNQSAPSWQTVTPMTYPRYQHNLVMLPDGKVLAVGGATQVSQTTSNGTLATEVWDPTTNSWSTTASMATTRNYHSIAMLLPDGRVLSAGGGRLGGAPDRFNAQFYSPSYLFKGSRPTITNAPDLADYSQPITVETPEAATITSVSLISLGSVTHTLDMNQRFVDLSFTTNSGSLTVNTPQNGNLAPAGYYMLFINNSNGVPSVAKIIRLGDTQAPSVTVTSPAEASVVEGSVTVTADAGDNVSISSVQFMLDGNNLGTADTTAPYTTSWDSTTALNGSHQLTVQATDSSGNTSTSEVRNVIVNNPVDSVPPVISNIQATSLTSTTATITWSTDENADSQVDFGITSAYGSSSPLDTLLVTNHSQTINNLTPNTIYHYQVKSKDAASNLSSSTDFTFTTQTADPVTVTFDDHPGDNQVLSGQYPTGVINWGSNQWYHSGPWGLFTTKSISFNGGGQTSGAFTFIIPKKLISLQAYNGGSVTSAVTIGCSGNTTKNVSVPVGQIISINTDFSNACSTVTLTSSNAWNTNFDNLVFE